MKSDQKTPAGCRSAGVFGAGDADRAYPPSTYPHRRTLTTMSALTKRGSTSRWRRLRAEVLDRDGHVCHWCKAPANTVDHVIPRARGGGDDPANLVAACGTCNSRRGQADRQGPSKAPPSREW